jgi:hypothetical protein
LYIVSFGISRAEFASCETPRGLGVATSGRSRNFIKICTPAPYLLYVNLYVEDVRSSAKIIFIVDAP